MSFEINIEKKLNTFTLKANFSSGQDHTALLGASGSGKSMILKCIAGIETPDNGFIKVNDRILFDSEKKINLKPQKRQVGYLFQDYALFPNFTVRKNIACVLRNKKQKAKVRNLLQRFDIVELADFYPRELSGGQKQRVALARLLAFEPDILMLDEAFSALDTFLKEKVELEMKEFLADYPGDVIIVSHDRNEAYRLCKKLVILDHGHTLEKGDLKQIFAEPQFLATSKITGTKNFSTIRKVDDYHLEALDWGIELQTTEKIGPEIRMIGIRAHDFYQVSDNSSCNSFGAKIVGDSQTPFEYQYLCQTKKKGPTLWWKVDKSAAKPDFTGYLSIAPEHIQLLRKKGEF